jgi:hypothetical protein
MSVSTGGPFWREKSGSAAHFYRQKKHRQVFQFMQLFQLLRLHIANALALVRPDGMGNSRVPRSERYRQKHRHVFPLRADPWRSAPRYILLILRDLLADSRMSAKDAEPY